MVRWAVLLLFTGCSAAPTEERRPLIEWHSWDQAFRLDPVHERVIVYEDGSVDARFQTSGELSRWKEFAPRARRFVPTAVQRDSLQRLLRDLERLKAAPAEDTGRICVLTDPAEESYRCETVVRVMPAWGKAWEIKRSLSDIALGFERMNPGLRRVLEQLDGLFREFLWKNEP